MLQFPNIYKRLLVYTLLTNKFPMQCSEIIWWLIQLSEVPIEIRYVGDGYIECSLVAYTLTGKRSKACKEFQPRNQYEQHIVESLLEFIVRHGVGE